MAYLLPKRELDLTHYSKNWGWFFLWGLALVLLGFVALGVSTLTTLASVVFLGVLILIGGFVVLVDAFKFWWGKWGGFFLHLLMGILYLGAGALLIKNPVSGAVSLTLILGVLYLMLGLFRIISSLITRLPNWGWAFFNGLIALLLGILILVHWPDSSLFIIGIFVAIDLISTGLIYAMLAISARGVVGKRA